MRAKRCATQCFKHVLECCKRSGEKKLPANTKLVFADHHFDLHVPSPASEALDSQEIALLSEQLEDIDLDDDEDFPGLI